MIWRLWDTQGVWVQLAEFLIMPLGFIIGTLNKDSSKPPSISEVKHRRSKVKGSSAKIIADQRGDRNERMAAGQSSAPN